MENNAHSGLDGIVESKKGVLLVDDEEIVRDTISEILEFMGYITYQAKNGQEAVNNYNPSSHGLVLMDTYMPVMDGMKAIPLILEKDREAKIVLMSGHIEKEGIELAIKSGAIEVIRKPINVNMIRDLTEKYI
jgi:CheY-like chemotaxis protein